MFWKRGLVEIEEGLEHLHGVTGAALPPILVKDFRALAFEPRAFACGHDGDGEFWCGHRPLWSHVRFWTD